ncbi:hypothetical protein [Chryseobacterium indologenes]|uniref:Uncharacterized protein n=1 Tax=Chryseobacterium indologenes TaxID=253 RepID=A0A0N0ZVM6_CHRID|nr:hypothetical protein [Chryseobacterium indologenes]KPE50989.1 hypothetical protein AOB46_12425 [Chryseobacterium indologenes]
MATYESLIKITGAVGDLVFYSLNGKNVVRKKSGFNKKAFKKSPSYEKVRQNSSEFGHCSKAGKLIRSCINGYIKEAGDPLLYQSFAKLMTDIKDLDTVSERGKRSVEKGLLTEKGKELLKAFQFGNKETISTEIRISTELQHNIHAAVKDDDIHETALISIKPDFEEYTVEYIEEQGIPTQEGKINFKNHFPDEGVLLYFLIIKNKDGNISRMGFV